MIKVGLTGGIGTGKTTVARIFSELQVPVYLGDKEAKKAYSDAGVLEQVKQLFGANVFDNHILNYKKLAQIVFTDKNKLKELNLLIHPFLIKDFEQWVLSQKKAPYVIMEAAIIFEASLQKLFDKIIAVTAPEALCMDRVMKRDGVSSEEFTWRSDNQIPNELKAEQSDYVIINNGKQLILPQVLEIHKKLLILTKTMI